MEKSEKQNEEMFNMILKEIKNLENKIDSIHGELKEIKKSTLNMDTHISFVETVYDTVKNPFYYIMNKIQPIQIKDKESKMITE